MSQRADFDRELAMLREDLVDLVANTPGADRLAPPGAFIGPPKKRGAAWRRVEDDAVAGRLSYRAAHFAAKHGLAALDAVEVARGALLTTEDIGALERLVAEIHAGVELARAAAAHASALYTDAFKRVAGVEGLASLRQSAKERGRPAKPSPKKEAAPGKRGRPSTAERDRLIADAIDAARAEGWGAQSIAAAKRVHPELFAGMRADTIRAAARRPKNPQGKSPKNRRGI